MIKQSMILLISSIIAGVLAMMLNIIITSNISVEKFGEFRYLINYYNFLTTLVFFGWQYSSSRVIAMSETKGKVFASASILTIFSTVIGIMITLIVLSYDYFINKEFSKTHLFSLVFLYPALLYYMQEFLLQGCNHIRILAIRRVLLPVFQGLMFYLYFNINKHENLINLVIINYFPITLIALVVLMIERPTYRNLKVSLLQVNEENKKHGMNIYLGSIFSVGVSQGITFWVSYFISAGEYGNYSLALSLAAPLYLVGSSIATAMYKENITKDEISNKLMIFSFILSFITYIGFNICLVLLFEYYYGESYSIAYTFSILLGLSFLLNGFGDIYNRFILAKGNGKLLRNVTFINGIIQIITTIIFGYFWGVYGIVLARLGYTLLYCLLMYYCYRLVIRKSMEEN